MVEAGDGACFGVLGAAKARGLGDFDCDIALQLFVKAEPDAAEGTVAEQPFDPIAADRFAGRVWHFR